MRYKNLSQPCDDRPAQIAKQEIDPEKWTSHHGLDLSVRKKVCNIKYGVLQHWSENLITQNLAYERALTQIDTVKYGPVCWSSYYSSSFSGGTSRIRKHTTENAVSNGTPISD
uniref:Uncharacterized protein n=1 Tax=Anopheles culicifacies TaxID=139723 RepID=A0A182M0B6_9DIPT